MTPRVCFRQANAALLMLKEPSRSMSSTVLKALELRSWAEHRKLPARRKNQKGGRGGDCTRSAVDEYVYLTPLLHHLLHSALARRHAAHVALDMHCAAAAAADGCSSVGDNVLAPADEGDTSAQGGKSFGDAETDAAAAACSDRGGGGDV